MSAKSNASISKKLPKLVSGMSERVRWVGVLAGGGKEWESEVTTILYRVPNRVSKQSATPLTHHHNHKPSLPLKGRFGPKLEGEWLFRT